MSVVFLGAMSLLLYTYVAYPLILLLLMRTSKNRTNPNRRPSNELPDVAVVVAAYNEEAMITNRINNVLEQDYPPEKLRVAIASDGSIDGTNSIVRAMQSDRVILHAFPDRRGRAAVHNDVCAAIAADIVVFSDAETVFAPDFVRRLVSQFGDPSVGCCAGELTFSADTPGLAPQSEGLYWRYERLHRSWESALGVLPFASGACLAVRRNVLRAIDHRSDVDNVIPLEAILQGYKVVYEPTAKAYDTIPSETRQQFRRRTRTAARSMRDILIHLPPLMKQRRFDVLWTLFSHRLLRWWASFALPLLYLSNLWLIEQGPVYGFIFVVQTSFYGAAALGLAIEGRHSRVSPVLSVPLGFTVANLAFTVATVRVVLGRVSPTYSVASEG